MCDEPIRKDGRSKNDSIFTVILMFWRDSVVLFWVAQCCGNFSLRSLISTQKYIVPSALRPKFCLCSFLAENFHFAVGLRQSLIYPTLQNNSCQNWTERCWFSVKFFLQYFCLWSQRRQLWCYVMKTSHGLDVNNVRWQIIWLRLRTTENPAYPYSFANLM